MAELGSTTVAGITIPLEVQDKATPTIKEVQKHFLDIANAMKDSGKSKKDVLDFLNKLVLEMRQACPQIAKFGKTLGQAFDGAKKDVNSLFKGKELQKSAAVRDLDGFLKNVGAAFIAFKAAVMPGQALRRFAEECTNINFKLSTMAMTAGLSVGQLSRLGNAYKAYGGSAADAVRGQRSYELEMERRRRGQGTGGVYTEVWKRYGIQYDPTEKFQDYFRRIIQWSTQLGNSREAKAAKLNLKNMLGLSDAEFRVMNKGLGAWEEEKRRNLQYEPASVEAAKSAESLTESTARLSAAWQNLKNRAFVQLAPLLEKVYNGFKHIVDALSKMPDWVFQVGVVAAGVAAALTSVAALIRGFKLLRGLAGFFGILSKGGGLLSGAAKASEVATSAASGASAASSGAGSAIAGGLGKMARAATGATIGNAVAGAVTAGSSLVTMVTTKDTALNTQQVPRILEDQIIPWLRRISHTVMALAVRITGSTRINEAVGDAMTGIAGYRRMIDDMAALPVRPGVAGENASKVSVGNINLSVTSSEADPKDVAKAVHDTIIEEFRILAEQDNTAEQR